MLLARVSRRAEERTDPHHSQWVRGCHRSISGRDRRSMHDPLHRNGHPLSFRDASGGIVASSGLLSSRSQTTEGAVRWRGRREGGAGRSVTGPHGMVETLEPVSSREVARLQHNAHGLLLLGVRPYQGFELCGSKLFGYLKAGRPILGVLPADESRKVLQRVGVSTVADSDSPHEIVQLIRDVLAAWSGNNLPSLLPDPDRCRAYEAESQTSALVRALEGLPALTPFIPGSAEIPGSLKGRIGDQGWINVDR